MSLLNIIQATPHDLAELVSNSRKIFYESFHHLNTPENMKEYMDRAFTSEQLLSELNNEWSEFYFADYNGEKIGYLKVNRGPVQSDIKDMDSLEVERIYVDAFYQGKGIGALLLDKAKARAAELQLSYMWLGVWEKNTAGIRFYEREGFVIFGNHKFRMGDDLQTDILMKYEL